MSASRPTTFTDVVATSSVTAETRSAKVATRTDDRIAGLIGALAAIELSWEEVTDLIPIGPHTERCKSLLIMR